MICGVALYLLTGLVYSVFWRRLGGRDLLDWGIVVLYWPIFLTLATLRLAWWIGDRT